VYQTFETLIQGLLEKGYGSVDNWYSQEELACLRKSLLGHYEKSDFQRAGIGKNENFRKMEQIRSDVVYWLDINEASDCERVFFRHMEDLINYMNRTCFAGIREYEFHYALYETGSFYRKHVDRFRNDDRRKYSLVSYLTENWQPGDGGELLMYTDGEVHSIEPMPGRLVLFSSDLPHEVLPTRIRRLSLTGWMKTS
jgi:SM-20-related protein